MQILFFALSHLALLCLFCVFGMTLLPEVGRRLENRNAFFVVSPLLGVAVWLALTVCLGTLLPYNAYFLGATFILTSGWIWIRRKTLFLPKNLQILWLFFVVVVFSSIMSRGISPTVIDGGLYFPPSVYDHVKCAIVNSISSHGLPPVNPWLADQGQPLPLVYYFGWHAWAAQLPILTGCSSLWAECTMTGFTFAVVLLGLAGFLTKFCSVKSSLACMGGLLLLVFFDIGYTNVFEALLPKSWMPVIGEQEILGFWSLFDVCIWSPQHLLAAALVILIIWFHDMLLHSENTGTSVGFALLIGLCAAAAVLNSVYAGAFALLMVALLMIYDYCRNRDFRQRFNHAFGWQIAAVVLSLALTAFYLKFLFSYPPEENPLAFGMMPSLGEITHFWQYPLKFLQFYLYFLPMRCGIIYLCGMLAIFLPGVLPEDPLMHFCKRYTIIGFLVIFFVHSTFYSNDFGWRFPAAPQFLLAVFATIFLYRIYDWLHRRMKHKLLVTAITATVTAVFIVVGAWQQVKGNFLPLKYDAALHRTFARAVSGWKIVQAHTGKEDLVLCNPAGFYEIGRIYVSTESTNVFYSLYAQRNTPVADLIFAKCYSEFYPQEKLEALYEKVVAAFNGNPSKQDADYLADELATRAILVTPLDGLWQHPGEIESRFPEKAETQDYRVYWRE